MPSTNRYFQKGGTCSARWNLDDIDNWEMEFYEGDEAISMMSAEADSLSGTELIWTNCDRLSEGRTITRDQFAELIMVAIDGLSQVFHRYLSGDDGRKNRIHIRLNGFELNRH